MKRREFLKYTAAAAGGIAVSTKGGFAVDVNDVDKGFRVPKRRLGRTGEKLSIIGFGGIVAKDSPREEVERNVDLSIEMGVNYFDTAAAYGNAEENMGPVIKKYRDQIFLTSKSHKRTARETEELLNQSLTKLHTDHLDLYQMHALTDVEKDVEAAFGPGGAIEAFEKAKKAGKIRFIGFSAHSPEAALKAMDMYDFDTILYPINFCCHFKGKFVMDVLDRAREKDMGILAIKGMALQKWGDDEEKKNWPKTWYEPIQDAELAVKTMSWTLSQDGVTAALPPGVERLYRMALANAPKLHDITQEESIELQKLCSELNPIFTG